MRKIGVLLLGLCLTACNHVDVSGYARVPVSSTVSNADGRMSAAPKRSVKRARAEAHQVDTAQSSSMSSVEEDITGSINRTDGLNKYSPEWWSAQEEGERASAAKLSKRLIICKGC